MNTNDIGGIANTDDPNLPQSPQSLGVDLPIPEDQAIAHAEKLVHKGNVTVSCREKLVAAREDAVCLRENAIDQHGEVGASSEVADARIKMKPIAPTEQISMLQQANAHLVISAIEAHKMAEQIETAKNQLDHLAHHDVLTDLPNRMLLQDRVHQSIELARRQGGQLALMFLDLDKFKHINDSLGHAVGDQLLRSVAHRLISCIRQSDTISRQGGDEFIVLLSHVEFAEDAAVSAQKILDALAVPHHLDGHELHIGVSIGISIYPNDGADAESLIKSADTAMYCAKESGRNNYKFFEADMNARAVQRHTVEVSLRLALERNEFVLYYQPKVDLRTDTIIGVEALIRWQHPEKGLLLPGHFVSIAEDCGLILPIGRWVLREACMQAQSWREDGLAPITIAVNTSALEFRAKDFIENIRAALADAKLEPRYLELELTESVLMRDAPSTDCVLHTLADMGVKLAIDDFGTGYSSLSYLRRFPVDTLKIDQSFVKHIGSNLDDATIVSAVINMGKSLNKRVIAEGVETPDQCAFLIAQHCDEGQGYYFGRPMAADALGSLLRTGISEKVVSLPS